MALLTPDRASGLRKSDAGRARRPRLAASADLCEKPSPVSSLARFRGRGTRTRTRTARKRLHTPGSALAPEPVDGLLQPGLDGMGRSIPKQALGLGDAGVGVTDVAGAKVFVDRLESM